MKDLFLPIRQAYWQALSGNITLDGKAVPVYDAVPDKASYPYVFFESQQQQAINASRSCPQDRVVTRLQIVACYHGGKGGRKPVDTIAEQIYALLTPPLPAVAGLDVSLCYRETDFDQGQEILPNGIINRRFIEFYNTVSH